MTIEYNLISINPYSRCGKKLNQVKGIVLHWVGNEGSTALQNRNYFEILKNQKSHEKSVYASAHFIVGIEGEIIQCIPVDEMAYHVGSNTYTIKSIEKLGKYPNSTTIGIELCHPDSSGYFTEKTLRSAEELCGHLLHYKNLNPSKDIWTHNQITGKNCPKYFVDNPIAFEKFKFDVNKLMEIHHKELGGNQWI